MDRIRQLRNPVQHYAWGSRTALAELRGRPSPAAEPEAELWIGAHPLAPSEVRDGDAWVPLDDWIARDPVALLGAEVAERFTNALPFLLKVLAAEVALSIQTHPDADQARRGFERENAAGLGLDDPQRCYRDPNAKPELICALTRFVALCGFRPRDEIAAAFARLRWPGDAPEDLVPILEILRSRESRGLARAFGALLTLPAARRQELARRCAEAAREQSDDPTCACAAELAQGFPGDVGILAPFWLNRIELEPGQALFLPAGELHSYLGGVGVELMGNSDNVLRGGLTTKHVDVKELLATLGFREGPPEVLEPVPDARGARRYVAPTREFALSIIDVDAERTYDSGPRGSVEIGLCTRGALRAVDPARGETIAVPCGSAVLLPAALPAYRIEGEGTLHRAGVAL